jgi:hypothetical protein
MNALAKRAMVVRRGDAPAKKWALGYASLDRQWWHSEGMRQPNGATPNRWVGGECAGKRRDQIVGECAGQLKQHQIGGGLAGDAPAKRFNTKSVAARRAGQTKQHQIGGSAANAPAKQKRMRRGDEMRRPNSNTKSVGRRRMRRQMTEDAARLIAGRSKKRRGANGMRRPNK